VRTKFKALQFKQNVKYISYAEINKTLFGQSRVFGLMNFLMCTQANKVLNAQICDVTKKHF